MKRLILIIAALAITSVAFAAGSYTLAPFDFGKVQLPKSNSGSYIFDTVTADQGYFLIIGSRVYKVDSAFFHKLAVDSIVSFSPLTILSTQINLGGGDVVVEQGRRMKIDTIFPANGKTVIGTVGDTAQFNSDLQKFTHKTLVDSLGLASAVDTVYLRISGDTVYVTSKKGSYFLNLAQAFLRVYDQNNTISTAALCSLNRADTNNVATNRVGLSIVIDSSLLGTTNKHIGIAVAGTGIGGKTASYYLTCDGTGSVYIRGDGLFSGTNFRSGGTTYYNSNMLNVVTTSNYTFQNSWASGYDWIFKDKGLATAAENVNFAQWQDSTGRIVHQLGGTNSFKLGMTGNDSGFVWDSLNGWYTKINNVKIFQATAASCTVGTDLMVKGLIKSGTFIVNFYDKDIQQYLYIPRNASINYEKSPISIAEPDSIIIDSVSFMAYYPPGTGADSNQIDSIWIKCDWSLVGEGSGGVVWSYGTDLIQGSSGFHKNTGLIKTSGTGKFYPTDRFIIYITGKKNENNTVEMTNLSAYCRYK